MEHSTKVLLFLLALAVAPVSANPGGCPLAGARIEGTPPLADGGLSGDFRRWLDENGYGPWAFARDDLDGGSYGGRDASQQALRRQPVVFVHGNSERAVGQGDEGPSGWTAVIRQFLAWGYGRAELYATTWGPADPSRAAEQVHAPRYVQRIRAFMEAVLDYTGAARIDVVAHSMGVTLARRAILGGTLDGRELGPALTDRIDAFVGIAGANLGLSACFVAESKPVCSDEDGFFPGYPSWFGVAGRSAFLVELNAAPGFEGARVYSIWSRADQLIGLGGLVYGAYTSRIPGQDGEQVYAGEPYGHFCVRDLSAQVQLEMVRGEW